MSFEASDGVKEWEMTEVGVPPLKNKNLAVIYGNGLKRRLTGGTNMSCSGHTVIHADE